MSQIIQAIEKNATDTNHPHLACMNEMEPLFIKCKCSLSNYVGALQANGLVPKKAAGGNKSSSSS